MKKIIETANWMERVNTLLKNKIRYAGDIDMVDTLINEGEKIGCKVYNPIMQLFWGSSPSLIKLNKIKEADIEAILLTGKLSRFLSIE